VLKMPVDQLIVAMKRLFGSDQRRIAHAMKVLGYAEQLLHTEPGSTLVVRAAAVLHDIGIHQAERKHGSSGGRYQEIEGPAIARPMMEEVGLDPDTIEHVCRIIANHHSARDIDTPEFRIVWDADWLVNIPDEFPGADRQKLVRLIDRNLRTPSGRDLARGLFLS
jgi:HD superfamily phosphodiesterase